ncbi:hypothetical protein VEx25_1422 [Vibrio antiquarius]|uniref:Uncharacterized protein n=1 Tax=Vibrio antiquarius (strain Ex25) TaxID=150340 RepID=A0ABM9WWW4_VIBAE|nr:hypothetical protein VEx25_1422 [Vibrio antiquarius]
MKTQKHTKRRSTYLLNVTKIWALPRLWVRKLVAFYLVRL